MMRLSCVRLQVAATTAILRQGWGSSAAGGGGWGGSGGNDGGWGSGGGGGGGGGWGSASGGGSSGGGGGWGGGAAGGGDGGWGGGSGGGSSSTPHSGGWGSGGGARGRRSSGWGDDSGAGTNAWSQGDAGWKGAGGGGGGRGGGRGNFRRGRGGGSDHRGGQDYGRRGGVWGEPAQVDGEAWAAAPPSFTPPVRRVDPLTLTAVEVEIDGVKKLVGQRVQISGLSDETSWQTLKDHLRQASEVTFCRIFAHGRAMVEFSTPEDAARAITELQGSELEGATIFLREDREDTVLVNTRRKIREARDAQLRARKLEAEKARQAQAIEQGDKPSSDAAAPSQS